MSQTNHHKEKIRNKNRSSVTKRSLKLTIKTHKSSRKAVLSQELRVFKMKPSSSAVKARNTGI